jgi:hypothetical protein
MELLALSNLRALPWAYRDNKVIRDLENTGSLEIVMLMPTPDEHLVGNNLSSSRKTATPASTSYALCARLENMRRPRCK